MAEGFEPVAARSSNEEPCKSAQPDTLCFNHISETKVPVGKEVTAYGTYNDKVIAINIGGGFNKLNHSLEPGAINQVGIRSLVYSIFGLIFCSLLVIMTNNYFVKSCRQHFYPLLELIHKMTADFNLNT
jgi:hypothetical protein